MLPVLLLALGRRRGVSRLPAAVCALRHRAGGLLHFLVGTGRSRYGSDLSIDVRGEAVMAEDLSAGITLETMETAQTRLAYFVAVTVGIENAPMWE